MFFSHFMLFPTFLKKNLGIQTNYFSFNDKNVGNFNMKLTGKWFPQIVD